MSVPPTTRHVVAVAALLLTVPAVVHAGTTTNHATSSTDAPAGGPPVLEGRCGAAGEPVGIVEDPSAFSYVDGLSAGSTADWSAGETLRIGAVGDCSLGVVGGRTATLTAATVAPNRGRVTGIVDVGREGALRFVRGAETNATAAIAIENVGRENSDQVAVVASNGTGATTSRERVTVPSGRFVAFAVRWYPDGTAHVWLWDTDGERPEQPTAVVSTTTGEAAWQVRLDGRAYLDEIAIGTADGKDGAPTPDGRAADGTEADDRFGFDGGGAGPPPEDDSPGRSDGPDGGVVLGPMVAGAGVLVYRHAYGITRFNEQVDAIGSTTRASEVEPAGWNVMLTKVAGVAGVVIGVGWLVVALL